MPVPPEAAAERSKEAREAREARRRAERLRILATAAFSYVLDTLWLTIYAAQGVIPAFLPAAYFLATAATVVAVYVVLVRGWNLRLRDPTMTAAQQGIGNLLQLVFLALAPQVGVLFLLTIFVVFAFGSFTMSVRQFVVNWLVVGLLAGGIVVAAGDDFGISTATPVQRVVVALAFLTTLGRVVGMSAQARGLRDRLRQRNDELREAWARADRLASVDALTQAWNRRVLLDHVQDEIVRAERYGTPFCIALLDLDDFKAVNDNHGHGVGDQVLQSFAADVARVLRSADKLGRFGGEEFLVLLPETPLNGGLVVAERVRSEILGADWEAIAPGLRVTTSIGVAAFRQHETVEELLTRCDEALYEAKRRGRNRTVAA